jgi:hypothetical protein
LFDKGGNSLCACGIPLDTIRRAMDRLDEEAVEVTPIKPPRLGGRSRCLTLTARIAGVDLAAGLGERYGTRRIF